MLIFITYFSLQWYILGKHSDFIYTENNNSQVDFEKSLLSENECLTSQIVKSSVFEHNPSKMANVGTVCTSINQQCFDLLNE